MAEKGFGVKEINLIGPSGTPTITSPNNLNLNAVNVAISTNVSIGGTLSVTGNVSIGGTLTYEDVTNIDSVGIITAPAVDVDDFLDVGSNIKLGNAGVVTATSFVGSGANLTGIVGGATGVDFNDNIKVRLGTGNDCELYHNGTDTYIANATNNFRIGNTGSTNLKFFTNNSTRWNIDGSGHFVPDTDSQVDIGTNSVRVRNIYADTLYGSGANLTNLPATDPTNSDIQVVYTVTANGASAYRFAGNGVVSTADNPDLYFIRGQKYRFVNNSGGSHPFQIREASGGTAYSTGVTNNGAASGNIDFAPTYDSPAQLVYQCTSHGGMVGNIYLRNAAGQNINVGLTTFVSDIDVDGHTNLDNVSIAGVTTFSDRAYLAHDLTITGTAPRVIFTDTNNNSDYRINVDAGNFEVQDVTNSFATRFRIDSSGRVLIGTTTEGETTADNLTIADSGHCGITIRSGTSSEGNIFFSDGTSGDAEYRGMLRYEHNNDAMVIKTATVERLRITSSGQLLNSANKSSEYTARFVQANSSNPAWIEIDSPADNNLRPAYVQLQNAGTNKWGIGQVYQSTSSGAFHIAAGAQNQANSKLTITTAGRVGINETSPDALLHLSTGASTTCELRLQANNTGSGAGDRGRISVYSALNNGTEYQAGYVDIDRSSGTDDIAHLVVALNDGSSVAERLRIASDGVITAQKSATFGNTSDSFTAVQITSSTSGISELRFGDTTANAGHVKYEHSNNALILATNTTQRLLINSDGNLIAGRSDFSYNDTSVDNTFLELYGGTTAGNRGILSLSGRTGSNNGNLGTIWFINANNASSSPGNTMRLAAAIQAKSVTSDSNAQNDSGAYIQFYVKEEGGSLTERVRISPEGILTKSKHPSFYVRRSTGGDGRSAATPITEWSSTYANGAHNNGSHFNTSTGLFTAPVSGFYHFSACGGYKQSSNNFNQKFRLNTTIIAEGTRFINYPDAHSTATISATIYMDASDTLGLVIETTHHVNTSLNYFSGHLVG